MRYVLFSLSAFVFYAIFYFAYVNGLDGLGRSLAKSGKLPSGAPLRTVYTGVESVDRILALLTVFFYPTLDGSSPTLQLHSIAFSGTFGAAWTLVVLESWRKGNKGTIAAYPAIFGLAAQLMTFAFATPLLCGLQLGSSVTARRPNADNISVPRAVQAALPLVFLIAYMAPTVAMILPVPSLMSIDMKQIVIAIWQPWPAYVSVLTTLAYYVLSPFFSNSGSISGLRWTYAFAFANATLAHLISWTISLASITVPGLFDKRYTDALHPSQVFGIPQPWSGIKIETLAEGVHYFLRWDYLIGSTGVLLWALALYTVAHKQIRSSVSWPGLLVKVGLLTVLTGPTGAAVELLWERDELVFRETGGQQRATTEKKL